MGLGRFGGGAGVTRWLARQGAAVTVTDLAGADGLAESLGRIADTNAVLHLGGHREDDFKSAELVVSNPAVPLNSPYLQIARRHGVPITSEIGLFVERCCAPCVGVTGSVGKSTITAMIGHILQRTLPEPRRVWIGGNIGRSLLDELGAINSDDIVVLELSSFQLELLASQRWSPHVAVISNVTPNHLDRHRTFAAYLAAKLNIVRFQNTERDATVIEDVPALRRHFDHMFGDLSGLWRYRLRDLTPVAVMQSTPAVDCDDKSMEWPDLQLSMPGRHNRLNAAAALSAAHLLGVGPQEAAEALRTFEGLAHRLQRAGEYDGVTYYNDSKSTTPEAALIAMQAIDAPLLIILGGYDKGSEFDLLAETVARRATFAACMGQTGPSIAAAIKRADGQADCFGDLDSAVQACRRQARPGDVVLLSPACASWDMFDDYRARGETFVKLVRG